MAEDDMDIEAGPQPESAPAPEVVREYRGTGIVAALVVGLIIAAAVVAFVAQNSRRVALEWLWIDFRASPAVLVLASLLVGFAADEILGLLWRRSRRRRLRDRDRLARLERE